MYKQTVSHITNGITTDVNNIQFPLNVGITMPTIDPGKPT